MIGWTPKNGSVADPGFIGVQPGRLVIMWPPVSVCHHVSTIGISERPMFFQYHSHASGLIGSPTVPRTRRLERSYFAGQSSPDFMSARIAVGAV